MWRAVGGVVLKADVVSGQSDLCAHIVGIAFQGLPEISLGLLQRADSDSAGGQVGCPSLEDQLIDARLLRTALAFGLEHFELQLTSQAGDDLVEDDLTIAMVALDLCRPDAAPACRLDQCDVDAQALALA